MGNSNSGEKEVRKLNLSDMIVAHKLTSELYFELSIRSPEEWMALAVQSSDRVFSRTTMVKAVVQYFGPEYQANDMLFHPPVVYFLNSEAYPTHLPFCANICHSLNKICPKNVICDTNSFNFKNYKVWPRQFILLSIVHYHDMGAFGVELWPGDNLPPDAIMATHERLKQLVYFGDQIKWRVSSPLQESLFKQVPLPNFFDQLVLHDSDLFSGVNYQPLHRGITYGICRIWKNSSMTSQPQIPTSSSQNDENLAQSAEAGLEVDEAGAPKVDRRTILVCEELPIDLNPIRGLITAQLQTPLCHVALLCTNRGTPNMALRSAMSDLASFDGQLICLTVDHSDYTVKLATEEEEMKWKASNDEELSLRPVPVLTANMDISTLVPLTEVQMPEDMLTTDADLGHMKDICEAIGSKALNLARFLSWGLKPANNVGNKLAFVIPYYWFYQHVSLVAGAEVALLCDPDTSEEDGVLLCSEIRSKILNSTMDEDSVLFRDVKARFEGWMNQISFDASSGAPFIADGVILRSSTNCEDLPGFPSAGLYESHPVTDFSIGKISQGILKVWASTFLSKAYLERREFGINERLVSMAVLVMPLLRSSVKMNGVAVTTNPFRIDLGGCYLNVQQGTLAVTDACQGHTPEQIMFIRDGFKELTMEYLSSSSLCPKGQHLMTPSLATDLNRILMGIHNGFRQFHTPVSKTNAADVEFFILQNDDIVILQARPVRVQHRPR